MDKWTTLNNQTAGKDKIARYSEILFVNCLFKTFLFSGLSSTYPAQSGMASNSGILTRHWSPNWRLWNTFSAPSGSVSKVSRCDAILPVTKSLYFYSTTFREVHRSILFLTQIDPLSRLDDSGELDAEQTIPVSFPVRRSYAVAFAHRTFP